MGGTKRGRQRRRRVVPSGKLRNEESRRKAPDNRDLTIDGQLDVLKLGQRHVGLWVATPRRDFVGCASGFTNTRSMTKEPT